MGVDYEGYIKGIIQKNPITIDADASFYKARALIRDKGIRHLPVLDRSGQLVGIVTDRDIRQAAPSEATTLSVHELHYLLGKLKVSAFMTPKDKLITISPATTIEEAVQLMVDHKIGCLPVVDGQRFMGLITDNDVLALFVDLFGLKQKGTRITLALEDRPGVLHDVLEIIKNHNVNLISVVTPTFQIEGKRVVSVRIATHDCENIEKDLKEKGFQILVINKWND